jgi:hypothetical protein
MWTFLAQLYLVGFDTFGRIHLQSFVSEDKVSEVEIEPASDTASFHSKKKKDNDQSVKFDCDLFTLYIYVDLMDVKRVKNSWYIKGYGVTIFLPGLNDTHKYFLLNIKSNITYT